MNDIKTNIEFINHASVLVSDKSVALLSDPWYFGDAFHKGWNLLYELPENEVLSTLEKTTHLWISHEHPDHLSIPFFRKYEKELKKKNIEILFQKTLDKRVVGFLSGMGFPVVELDSGQEHAISDNFSLICIKDGIFDSALLIKVGDEKILNLNDCVVRDTKRAGEVHSITGDVDILFTQFSYAAWKGGKDNKKWRQAAAKEKRDSMKLQTEVFHPKTVVPFASFIYFSNERNFYLNHDANKPSDLFECIEGLSELTILKPFDKLGAGAGKHSNDSAISFWDDCYSKIQDKEIHIFERIELDGLNKSFQKYKEKIFKDNSIWFMKLLSVVSPISVFKPIIVELDDMDLVLSVDIFSSDLHATDAAPDLVMSSESLDFIFKNTFGFDTLTVNGCFEERRDHGFSRAVKSLGIGTFNNNGIHVSPMLLLDFKLIFSSLRSLFSVQKNIDD